MQDEDTRGPPGKSVYAQLPFHLRSLEFDIALGKLQLLTSEQLALVQFHPEATESIKAKAEILFFKRREQDQHLLETLTAPEGNVLASVTSNSRVNVESAAQVSSGFKESTSLVSQERNATSVSTKAADPESSHRASISSFAGNDTGEHTGNSLKSLNETEEGEVSDSGKTPTPEIHANARSSAIKHEDEVDDVIVLDGPSIGSSRQLPRHATSGRRTSVPVALNVGATYSGRKASQDVSSQSLEPRPPSGSAQHTGRNGRSPTRYRTSGEEESAKGGEPSTRRRDRERNARDRESTSEKQDKRDSRRRHDERARTSGRHSHKAKRQRRRSYSSSSGSSGTSGSSTSGSSSSQYSGSSSSYTSSRSRSTTPERRRRRRRRHDSHRAYAPQYIPQYSTVPVPMQMQMPMTVVHQQPSEETVSRQELSHMYRNMPSNPAELNIQASTSYASSPPRQAHNSFTFPGQADAGNRPMSGQPMHMRSSSVGNMHPARTQAISTGQTSRPYEPSPPYNGQDNRRNGRQNPGLPPRPKGTGWPDPPPPAPRRNAGWPDDRPNRPRQDRRPDAQNGWGAADGHQASKADAWGASSTTKSGAGSRSVWGDAPAGNADPWGETTAGGAVSNNNPWGSPSGASASTKPADKAKGSAWGDVDSSANKGSSVWD